MLSAQPYYFRRFQVENGLSNNTVFCSTQDRSGFMWFGTKDGLNRFDGSQFRTYRHDPEVRGSIGNDLVYALHYDNNNRLWIGTNQGVYLYHPQTESFSIIEGTEQLRINDLGTDNKGNLWIVSLFRIHIYAIHTRKLVSFGNTVHFDANSVTRMRDGSMWISTMQGTIEKFNSLSGKFESHYVLNRTKSRESSWVTKTLDAGNGQLLIGTANQGLKIFDLRTQSTKDILTYNADQTSIYVRDLARTSLHEFWIASESGIYVYNIQNNAITQLKKQYSDPYSLSDNAVYTVFRDRENGIWAGSFFGGVNYYSQQNALFTKFFPKKDSNSISGSDVREICKDIHGNLWIGTEDAGLNMQDAKSGIFSNFLPDGRNSSIAYSNIHGLLIDGNKLWIGTFEHGLDIMDVSSKKVIKHYSAGKENSLRTNFIVTFCKTSKGEILVATIAGLYRYNKSTDDFELIPGLPAAFFQVITEDRNGNLWAGTFNDGVFKFRIGEKNVLQFKYDPANPNSIGHNTINGIFEDSRSNIWISTDGGGLNRYKSQNQSFERITKKEGLPSNFLFKMLEDDEQKIWVGSTRGLVQFDPQTHAIKTFSKANGLLTDQFNYSSGFKDTDGRMYFGSVRGLISFHPSDFKDFQSTAPVKITGFQVDNEESKIASENSILQKSISYTDKIVLNDESSSFSIDFAALSYISPDMTQYAYRMTGLNNSWVFLKSNRKVYFTKLAAGNYTFEVKALLNGTNKWSTDNAKIFITILPPFYRSNLAYLLYFLCAAALIIYFVSMYHRRIMLKNKRRMELFENKKEKEVYQAKIEFFTNIAHEIRTPLTLIKGPMEKVIRQAASVPYIEKNLRLMDRNTDRLLNLTNQLLDFRKTEVRGFSLSFVKGNITEILHEIFLIFQPLADEKDIQFSIQLPPVAVFAYIDTEAFYKIMSNLIDNAIKYGQNKVCVQFSLPAGDTGFFRITVLNDGPLIPEELRKKIFEPFFRASEKQIKQGTGIGLSIAKSLAELHSGQLYAGESDEKHNSFILELPVHQLIEFNLKGKWKKQ